MGIKLSGKTGGIAEVITDNSTISGNGSPESPITLNELALKNRDKYFLSKNEREQIELNKEMNEQNKTDISKLSLLIYAGL